MDELFDPSTSLLCDENAKDLCFDHLDDNQIKSEPLIHPPEQSDEGFFALLERETDYLPKHDYLNRLRSGGLHFCARKEAFHWISKAHWYHSFGPLSLCLAVNYLDRFLSVRELPSDKDKDWTVQLLAVACLSIAAKIEETSMPLSLELQVGDPKYVFEAKTIQRMELLVLDTLQWKMNAVTPCSFIDYSLKQLSNPNSIVDKYLFSMTKVVNRSMELILCTMKGIDYLEFKASEVAAAVAMSVAAEIQAVDIDKASYCFIHLNKDRVLRCVEMIKEISEMYASESMQQGVPLSPIGVLDVECFSYKSDEFTSSHLGSSSNSSQISATATATANATATTTNSDAKRMKLDPTSTSHS